MSEMERTECWARFSEEAALHSELEFSKWRRRGQGQRNRSVWRFQSVKRLKGRKSKFKRYTWSRALTTLFWNNNLDFLALVCY
jgi:hypothetical protein